MLEIKNLSRRFNAKQVLDQFSLKVNRGELAVLLGSSGVGKSTLLRILNHLETFDSGEIRLDGQLLDLNQINQTHKIGMVFQQFNLFEHLSVLQNITLALEQVEGKSKSESEQIAKALLQQYGLQDKAQSRISDLSGGQKQRLAIIRTLALRPAIICFDEPTSALDPLLTSYVAQTLINLAAQGYIVLITTHDTSLLDKLQGTVYLMNDGKIVESANIEEFNNNKAKFPNLAKFVSGNHPD